MRTFLNKAADFVGFGRQEDVDDIDFGDESELAPVVDMYPDDKAPLFPGTEGRGSESLHKESFRRREEASVRESSPVDNRRIFSFEPASFEDVHQVGEAFRDGDTVIINVDALTKEEARRIIDFCIGLTFGLRGQFERIANRVFLLTPPTVEVVGERTVRSPRTSHRVQG